MWRSCFPHRFTMTRAPGFSQRRSIGIEGRRLWWRLRLLKACRDAHQVLQGFRAQGCLIDARAGFDRQLQEGAGKGRIVAALVPGKFENRFSRQDEKLAELRQLAS